MNLVLRLSIPDAFVIFSFFIASFTSLYPTPLVMICQIGPKSSLKNNQISFTPIFFTACVAPIFLFNICISRFNTFSKSTVKAAKGLRKATLYISSTIKKLTLAYYKTFTGRCTDCQNKTFILFDNQVYTALGSYNFDRSLHTVAPIIRLLASTMSAQKGNGNPLESNLKKGWVHIP